MCSLARSLLILFALSSIQLCVMAQGEQKTGTGVINGHVTVGGKAAPGVVVVATPGEIGPDRREVARTTTDYEGNYRLTGLPAGRFSISPVAPTMLASSDNMYGGMGRSVIVSEGETIEKIDFTLTRGGVITGRITDADGRPVIEERVQLTPVDNPYRSRVAGYSNPFMYQTDDRGVYRLYGVSPGRYTLSVGVSPQEGMVRAGMVGRTYYQRTFYPGETDSQKAGIIEVPEGGEVKDVDIKLGQRSPAFSVSGRVTDAATGQPVANLLIGYGTYNQSQKRMGAFGFGQSRTDARGQFTLEGIVPGSFAAFVWNEPGAGGSDTYSEPILFTVTDGDVDGLALKVRHGASISGVAQIEGTSDKRVLARLSQLIVGFSVQSNMSGALDNTRPAVINADGSFRVTGLPPGRASIYLSGYPQPKDIKLARVERDGVAQTGGIEISAGAEVSNVRLVFEYGNGSIRGQVRAENGEIPEGSHLFIMLQKPGDSDSARPIAYSQADTRGRFILEGLAPGEYQLVLRVQFSLMPPRRPAVARQSVTVASGVETEANLTLDMSEKETEGKQP
jgi:protocatechuate 3,4-dioxygenase beta subunit